MSMELYGMDDILAVLPHRPPFLFVDRVVKLTPHRLIVTERTIPADEYYFKGHFPGQPIMPGVLVTDGLAQTSGLLFGLSRLAPGEAPGESGPQMFLLAAANVKFLSPALPGDLLIMKAHDEKGHGALFRYGVEAMVGKRLIAQGILTLAMSEENP